MDQAKRAAIMGSTALRSKIISLRNELEAQGHDVRIHYLEPKTLAKVMLKYAEKKGG